MSFKDLQIGDTFYCPYMPTEHGYIKTSETQALFAHNHEVKEMHPGGIVMKVDLDEHGKVIMPPPSPHVPIELWGKNHPDYKLPGNWNHYGTRISWQNSKLTINQTGMRYGTKTFFVTLDEGEWPKNDIDLITLCDGSVPPNACHFGGRVGGGEKERKVELYFD